MSKMSQTQIDRKFDWDKDKGIVRREAAKEAVERRNIGNCFVCGMSVYVSPGQFLSYRLDKFGEKVFSHKSCRRGK